MDYTLIKQWYEQYKAGLFRFVLSIVKDSETAEDILQEVFLRLLTGRYTPEPGKEQAYLYRMARNLCYDELRYRNRHSDAVKTQLAGKESYAYLELIAPLRQKDQEIVTLKIVGGLTYREIGKVLGLTEQAVKKRYQRAIKMLREE